MGLYHSIYLLNALNSHSLRTGDQKSSLENSVFILFELNQFCFANICLQVFETLKHDNKHRVKPTVRVRGRVCVILALGKEEI